MNGNLIFYHLLQATAHLNLMQLLFITHPAKIHAVVVYRPPGQLGNFLEELDVLLSNFPEDGTPLVLLGDFNIHLEKPQATDFNTLLTSFDLKRVSTMATHKSGNQLDLIYTRYCSTDNTLVTPLHTSDHFLITSNLTLTPDIAHAPSQVTFRHNLRSLPLAYPQWFHSHYLHHLSFQHSTQTVLLTLFASL